MAFFSCDYLYNNVFPFFWFRFPFSVFPFSLHLKLSLLLLLTQEKKSLFRDLEFKKTFLSVSEQQTALHPL